MRRIAFTLLLCLLPSLLFAATLGESLEKARKLVDQKKFSEAVKLLTPLKGTGKEEALRFFNLSRAYAGLKKWDDAEQANQRAAALDPMLLETHYNNACYASLSGNAEKAVHHLEVLEGALSASGDTKKRARFERLMSSDADLGAVRKHKRWTELHDKIAYGMPKAQYLATVQYKDVITKTAGMVGDQSARKLAKKHGLDVLNITWEDTGRYKGSSVGPNISDMTIQVAWDDPASSVFQVTAMPVIRFPNYDDKTGDLDPADFTLLVGNQDGKPLKRISLYELLKDPTAFLSKPGSWAGKGPKTLLAPERDSKVLVSAQAAFLPIPKLGAAEFNPVIFNYQSQAGDPAVLTILVTREGTSVTVIDNQRDAFQTGAVWGQRLFHNHNGERASLTGQRKTDFKAAQAAKPGAKQPKPEEDEALNMVLLVQVPLKQKNPMRHNESEMSEAPMDDMAMDAAPSSKSKGEKKSDVEDAVIGHGKVEGPFTEIDNLTIERDPKFPVRVTVQFYKATSNGAVDAEDLADIKRSIDKVYGKASNVGSLVTQGETGRVTEYAGAKVQPKDWWETFWVRYEKSHKMSRKEAILKLRKILGEDWQDEQVTDLYLRGLLKKKPT